MTDPQEALPAVRKERDDAIQALAFECEQKQDEIKRLTSELADLKRRYLTPMFPRVLDDALVRALESRRGTIQASDLLGPARAALVNRRRMAEMLAKSAAGQPWLKCPGCGDEWALAGPPTVLADSEVDELRKALEDERQTRAALEAQVVTLRGAAEIGAENERRLQAENERLALEVDGLKLEAQFQRESADRAARSFLTAQGERDTARTEVGRLQAEIDSKNRLLPSLLAEGKQLEQARAEKAEAEIAELRAQFDHFRNDVLDGETGLECTECERITNNGTCTECRHGTSPLAAARRERDEARAEVAAAVLREREECAALMATLRPLAYKKLPAPNRSAYIWALDDAADAIRARSK